MRRLRHCATQAPDTPTDSVRGERQHHNSLEASQPTNGNQAVGETNSYNYAIYDDAIEATGDTMAATARATEATGTTGKGKRPSHLRPYILVTLVSHAEAPGRDFR